MKNSCNGFGLGFNNKIFGINSIGISRSFPEYYIIFESNCNKECKEYNIFILIFLFKSILLKVKNVDC